MKIGSRSDVVYEAVIRRILSGDYRPGQLINRRDVAAALNVSISPVSEAFAILQAEGIIKTVPRKGTFIAKLDWKDIQELTDVRSALEAQAARVYCGRRLFKQQEQFLALADVVDCAEPVSFEHLKADITIHRRLVRLAGNQHLAELFERVITRSLLLAMEGMLAVSETRPEALSHRRLILDLCEAEPEEADRVIRHNIYHGKEPILNQDHLSKPSRTFVESTTLDVVLDSIETS